MDTPTIVSPQEWQAEREKLLVKEKELTRARDALAAERRRVRYRLRSAPMQVAQQFLAALARDWDGRLDALQDHLNRNIANS